ncbi:MAG: ComF family protein [Candidatus Rokuibacteriota bacterium]|nr:MAG: ComF family protein [Candidatus Rokubacteria bacterium]
MLDLLLPRRCVVCRAVGEQLCATCAAALPRLQPPLCERCGAPTVWPVSRCGECAGRRLAFGAARAAVVYDRTVKGLIRDWKERGLRGLAVPAAGLVAGSVPRPDVAMLTFVPPDGDRLLQRGHHPAEALARELGRCWTIPVQPLLVRTGPVPRQAGLTLAERRRNVRTVFRGVRSCPTSVCLVDDVYTSGATADAAARALRRAGARRVSVCTFTRAVR